MVNQGQAPHEAKRLEKKVVALSHMKAYNAVIMTDNTKEGVPFTGTWSVVESPDFDEAIFIGKYGDWCTSGVDATDTDALDALFRAHSFPLAVDRTRLKDDKEAWIHVLVTRVDETSDDRFHPLVEFSSAEAIFTFENSDWPTVGSEELWLG